MRPRARAIRARRRSVRLPTSSSFSEQDRRFTMEAVTATYGPRMSAFLLTAAISFDIAIKGSANLQDLMWACYWAAAVVVTGVLLDIDRLVSAGLLFFLAIGFPAWLVGIFTGRPVTASSVLFHTIPTIGGSLYFSTTPPPSYRTGMLAWMIYVLPALLSWSFCTPTRHINLVHWVWPPAAALFPTEVAFQAFLFFVTAIAPLLVTTLLKEYRGMEGLRSAGGPCTNGSHLSNVVEAKRL